MVTRLTHLVCVAALVASALSIAPSATAAGEYVRDLSQMPADVRWRHSGHQGPGFAAEYYGRELVKGDFNHDGRTDFAVGADTDTGPTDTSFGRGFVYVYFGTGSSQPPEVDPAEQAADCRIFGEAPFSYFGQELAVGDFDGDGVDDIAITQIEGTTVYRGAVYLVSGATIAANHEVRVADGQYISKLSGRTVGARYQGHYLYFGFGLTAADFNGDGVDDVAASAFGGYGPDGARPESGDIEIFLGRRNAWPREIVANLGTADVFILGRRPNINLGTELASGDVDGDGRPELLAASFGSNGPDDTRSFSGDVTIYSFGALSPIILPSVPAEPASILWDAASTPPSAIVWGPLHGSRIGSSASDGGGKGIAVADIDGDGVNDVVIGAPFNGPTSPNSKNPGAVFVVWGGASLTSRTVIDLVDASNSPASAASLVAEGGSGESLGDTVRVGDINGDGRAEIIAGAPDANDAEGYAAVFGGRSRDELPPSGPMFTQPDAIIRGSNPVWRFGDDALFLDATFAGHAMLLVGAPYGGFIPLGGRGYAGEIDGVFTDGISVALPRAPSITAQASVTLAPNGTATVPVAATAGTGVIISLTSPDLPTFAQIQTIDAASGLYVLRAQPDARGSRHTLHNTHRDRQWGPNGCPTRFGHSRIHARNHGGEVEEALRPELQADARRGRLRCRRGARVRERRGPDAGQVSREIRRCKRTHDPENDGKELSTRRPRNARRYRVRDRSESEGGHRVSAVPCHSITAAAA